MITGFTVSLGWAVFDLNVQWQSVLPFDFYNLTVGFVVALMANGFVSLVLPDRATTNEAASRDETADESRGIGE